MRWRMWSQEDPVSFPDVVKIDLCVIQNTEAFSENAKENICRNSDEQLQRCLGSTIILMIIYEKAIAKI